MDKYRPFPVDDLSLGSGSVQANDGTAMLLNDTLMRFAAYLIDRSQRRSELNRTDACSAMNVVASLCTDFELDEGLAGYLAKQSDQLQEDSHEDVRDPPERGFSVSAVASRVDYLVRAVADGDWIDRWSCSDDDDVERACPIEIPAPHTYRKLRRTVKRQPCDLSRHRINVDERRALERQSVIEARLGHLPFFEIKTASTGHVFKVYNHTINPDVNETYGMRSIASHEMLLREETEFQQVMPEEATSTRAAGDKGTQWKVVYSGHSLPETEPSDEIKRKALMKRITNHMKILLKAKATRHFEDAEGEDVTM